jgi:exonuclease III
VQRLKLFTILLALVVEAGLATRANAQLRIVDYNTAGIDSVSAMTTVLSAINSESVNGIAKPIDAIILQELSSGDIGTVTSILNGLGVGTYVASNVGTTTGAGGVGLVYRTQSIDLIEQQQVVNTSSSGAARGVMRFVLRPDGYDAGADFYIYNSHFKASDSSADAARRNVEAAAIRTNSNALGEGAHVIYAGDFNIYRSSEPMWATLTAAGNGQAFDPVNRVGTWHDGASFRDVHTQNPAGAGGVGGGMDDRFDWQMVTGELMDGEGMSIIAGSYHAFGNNNTHTMNGHINTGSGASPTVLNALGSTSDHLPVVADYQLPAVLSAVASAVPTTINVGELFNLNVTVQNAANVLAAFAADELDYAVTTSGSVLGSFLNQVDAALGVGNVHQLTLDTSTLGAKTGTIFVQSSSQGAANAQIQIPISYEVLAASLDGDFNHDGFVDAADYTVWRDGLDAEYTLADYDLWKANFGESVGGGSTIYANAAVAVPEPYACFLLATGCVIVGFRSRC